MLTEEKKARLRRGILALLAAALLLLSGCAREGNPAAQEAEPEAPPRTGETETFGAETVPEHSFTAVPALAETLAGLPEGECRLFRGENADYLLNRDGIYAAPRGSVRMLGAYGAYLYGSRYYLEEVWTDGSVFPLSAVYDGYGVPQTGYDDLEVLFLEGDTLVRGREERGSDYARDVRFERLGTGETLLEPGRCRVAALYGGYWMVSVCQTRDSAPETLILDGDLRTVRRFADTAGETAKVVNAAQFWVRLLPEEGEEMLYLPASDTLYPKLVEQAANAVWVESGTPGLYDLIGMEGEVLEKGAPFRKSAFWTAEGKIVSDGETWLLQLGDGPEEPIASYSIPMRWRMGEPEGPLKVLYPDGRAAFFDSRFQLLATYGPAEGEYAVFRKPDGWFSANVGDSLVCFGPEGECVAVRQEKELQSLSPLWLEEGNFRFYSYDPETGGVIFDETGREAAGGLTGFEQIAGLELAGVTVDGTDALIDLDGNVLWKSGSNPVQPE